MRARTIPKLNALFVAAIATAVATLARFALDSYIDSRLPLVTYYAGIVVVSLVTSRAATIASTVAFTMAGAYFFLDPRFSLAITSSGDVLRLVVFLATGLVVTLLSERVRDTRVRLRRAAEAEAQQAREMQAERKRLRDLVDSIPGVVWEAWGEPDSKAQRIDYVSDYVEKMVGYRPEEWTSTANFWLQLVHPDDREAAAKNAFETFDSGEPGENEFRWITKGGQVIWVAARSTTIRDENGKAVGMRGVTFDITQRKEGEAARAALAAENARLAETARREAEEAQIARSEAEEAGRVKDEFLATLSHELRTPLNAILGWAHMLRDPQLSGERRQAAIETILRNAQSQEQLISDILDVQRIMAGKIRLNLRSVDLGNVVRSAAETVQPTAEAKGVRVQLILDLDTPTITGDPDRLQQIVWNLLSNAIKFAPQNGHVRVRLLKAGDDCELIVEDDGPGINQEFLPHVFERFRQADSSTTRTHKGLGLGLAIVRSLVEMHGGTIHAANTPASDATGAVFTIRLPREAATGVAATETTIDRDVAWASDVPSLDGLRVLVVEDDHDARELLGVILQRCGASVTLTSSAAEGMAAFDARRPDVLVSDIEMPMEDGYGLIRRIRARSPADGGNTPAAALTAYASAADRMKVLGAGFNIHVAKPVQPTELAIVVASLAGRRTEARGELGG
jgi:PAS domain S-box-containing protein